MRSAFSSTEWARRKSCLDKEDASALRLTIGRSRCRAADIHARALADAVDHGGCVGSPSKKRTGFVMNGEPATTQPTDRGAMMAAIKDSLPPLLPPKIATRSGFAFGN